MSEEDVCAEGTLSERGKAPFETMKGLNRIPQVKSNTTSTENTNRMKTRLLIRLKIRHI